VYPALAVLAELSERTEVLWVGGVGGMEAALVERAKIRFHAIPAAGVHGVGIRRLPGNLWSLLRGVFAARRVLAAFKPDVLFFTGGYVGVPVGLAGWRVPKVVFVPDLEPGLALKMLSRMANRILITAEQGRTYYRDHSKVVVSGYPIRKELQSIGQPQAMEMFSLHGRKPVILVFGGSRGARSINKAVWQLLVELLELAQVIHITGASDWPEAQEILDGLPPERRQDYHVYEYLHEEMGAALSAADLVISRAGASTLGEFPVFGLPAILVPYPYAWRYQKVNASYLVDRGAAVMVADDALQAELLATVRSLLQDPARLDAMCAASQGVSRVDAAAHIAEVLSEVAGEGGHVRG